MVSPKPPPPPPSSSSSTPAAHSTASPALTSLSHHLQHATASSSSARPSSPTPSTSSSRSTRQRDHIQQQQTSRQPTSTSTSAASASASASPAAPSLSSASAAAPSSSLSAASSSTATAAPAAITATTSTSASTSSLSSERIWRSAAARKAERNWKRQSEKSLSSDARYRKYAGVIDRALASFDSVAEWADFVGALARLEKIFSSPPPLPTSLIPRSLLLSKRLAQCLNPALPSGVHHRALSVYRQIFLQLSTDGLRRDLSIWSPGLLPFFERANTSTRPIVLALLEEFYLPLGEDLKPMARAFILAVLPGLEEEGAENFDRTLRLLDGLQRAVGDALFWRCLWTGVVSNSGIRQAAINFLAKRSPATAQSRDDSPTLRTLVARAFSALLTAQDLLIVRGGLDLLLEHLPLHSSAWQATPWDERVQLTKSATAVVLRRELSLNRRLWTWLGGDHANSSAVGAASNAEDQEVAYLRKFSIDVLKESLLSDMTSAKPINATKRKDNSSASNTTGSDSDSDPDLDSSSSSPSSSPAARQQPYRIFLALLDKWSVGSTLTEALILDCCRAVEVQVRGASAATLEVRDFLLTAGMLFDAVDKEIWCRVVVREMVAELPQGEEKKDPTPSTTSASASSSLAFALTHFSFKDDAYRNVHLPNLLAASLSLAQQQSTSSPSHALALARICQQILPLVSPAVFAVPQQQQQATGTAATPPPTATSTPFHSTVLAFYGASPLQRLPIDFQQSATLTALLQTSTDLASSAIDRGHSDLTVASLSLGTQLLDTIAAARGTPPSRHRLDVDARAFSSRLLTRLSTAPSFAECDALITVLVAGSKCTALASPIDLKQASASSPIIARLTDFLQPAMSTFHARATDLFWQTEKQSAPSGHLQSLISQGVLQSSHLETDAFQRAIEAFGAFWRHSSDEQLLSDAIAPPLARILDLLRSPDIERKQCGETWLRRNVRSYAPIFRYFLHSLRSTGVQSTERKPFKTVCANGIEVHGLAYTRAFDHEVLNHLLASLLSVARYGAAGFVRGARNEGVVPGLSLTAKNPTSPSPSSPPRTYLDEFVEFIFLLLKTDAAGTTAPAPQHLFQRTNAVTHALAADLLQILASRGALTPTRLHDAETLLLERLLISVQTHTVSRQHKLLLTLHGVITTSVAAAGKPPNSDSQRRRQQDPQGSTLPNPLLLAAIAAAISTQDNRGAALPHWVDFILMTVPYYRRALTTFLIPLNDRLCRAVRGFETSLRGVTRGDLADTSGNEADVALLLTALERVMTLCIDESHAVSIGQHEEDAVVQDAGSLITPPPPAAHAPSSSTAPNSATTASAAQDASTGLLGYVTGIFGGEASAGAAADASEGAGRAPKTSATLSALQLAIGTLHSLWSTLNLDSSDSILAEDSRQVLASKIKSRCRRIIERLYKSSPSATAEILIDYWHRDTAANSRETVFEILGILTPGAQTLVTYLCDTLSTRLPSPGSAKPTWTPDQVVSETTLLTFLETFLERTATSEAGGVWPVVIMLVKDLLANSAAHKAYLFPALRLLTVLGEKLIQTSTADDKKIKRELQETYSKLFDLCVLIAGRSFDSTTWIRRSARDTAVAGTPTTADSAVPSLDEKAAAAAAAGDPTAPPGPAAYVDRIVEFLAHAGLSALRKFAIDQDKLAATCSNAVYYIIAPPLRQKGTDFNVPESVLLLASEIAKVPGALKALRSPISEAFWDPRFFRLSPSAAQKWRTPVLALYKADKERFLEMLGRVSAAPTANINIFANRRAETLLRAQNLRRLTFVIYAAGQGQFLPLLPAIQERLVDVLRANASSHSGADIVNAEVYLCLRAMLCRFDAQHLTTLWPIVITEMMRLFDTVIEEIAAVNADSLQLILSACKFLDLMITLQANDFQMQQWLFINDTGLTADESMEESILDRFAAAIEETQKRPSSRLGSNGSGSGSGKSSSTVAVATRNSRSKSTLRRPLLAGVTDCSNLEQLLPFLRRINSASFGDNVAFAANKVDVRAVEADLRADLFRREPSSSGKGA